MLEQLQKIIDFLEEYAGEFDMASLLINSEGKIYLRHGCCHSRDLTLEELVNLIDK